MPQFQSKINPQSKQFSQNHAAMMNLIEKTEILIQRAKDTSDKKRSRFEERGQLTPSNRLKALLDPNSEFVELYNMANYLVDDPNPETSIPGGNIITGIGFVSGVRCLIMVDDSGISAGAITGKTVDKALGCIDVAMKQKLPFIHLVESAGVNLLNYTVDLWAQGGGIYYGKAKLSAAGIPVIAVLHGLSTAGGAYQPGMSDYVVGVKNNGMAALAGPALLKAATGEDTDKEELGGSQMHSVITGLVEYLADDDSHALEITRNLVSRLNWKTRCNFPKRKNFREPAYSINEIPGIVPEDFMRGYDIKEVIARITDNSDFMEIKPKYGPTMICLQAEIEGYSVGILGNNGPIDTNGATKAAHFIQLCDQADIPLIFLNNVTGYMVGKKYEQEIILGLV